MIDINAILTQAFNEALKPLVKRIEELEAKQAQPQPTPPIDIAAATDVLSQQEWFWERVRNFIDAGVDAGLSEHLEEFDHHEFVSESDLPDFDYFLTKDEAPDLDDVITTENINEQLHAYLDEYLTRVRITRL